MTGRGRNRLRVLRAERDVTQIQVAGKAGINVTRYWQIEHGVGLSPNPDEKTAVAAALGVKVSDIAWPDVANERATA